MVLALLLDHHPCSLGPNYIKLWEALRVTNINNIDVTHAGQSMFGQYRARTISICTNVICKRREKSTWSSYARVALLAYANVDSAS
jgi:hypothetical protein